MRTHFDFIFWGLLLVLLHLSINGFDLLVDGVGYLLVARDCGGMASVSPRFSTARVLSLGLALLWLVGLFAMRGDAAMVFGIVTTVANCVMMWMLLGGIIELATIRSRPDLADRAANRRLVYVILAMSGLLLGLAARGSGDLAVPLAVMAVVLMIVVVVMILHLIHRVRSELAT